MKLIVGLGNIGREYVGTRHNVGFMVADAIAQRWQENTWKTADNALYVEHRCPEKVLLIKPTTFMNLSGLAVADFVNFYHLQPEDVLVVQDDLDLPTGFFRVRQKGSSGGHNGLKSIEQALGSQEYMRLKIGIGHPSREGENVTTHVLQRFSTFEEEAISQAIAKAVKAVDFWLAGEVQKMLQLNSSKKKMEAKSGENTEQPEI